MPSEGSYLFHNYDGQILQMEKANEDTVVHRYFISIIDVKPQYL